MKSRLVVMLTLNDVTIKNAIEVFESCKDLPIDNWGFKNVGISIEERIELARLMREANKNIFLEDVLNEEKDLFEMAEFAVNNGVKNICGRFYDSVNNYISDKNITYFASSTMSSGSPVMLRGPVNEIINQLKGFEKKGVEGFCIGAYRHESSPEELIQGMTKELKGKILIAGSINSKERMAYVNEAGCYGFTMGSAIFNHKYKPNGNFRDNLIEVIKIMDEIN